MTSPARENLSAETHGLRTVRVVGRHPAGDDLLSLVLAAEDGSALPAWTPGAHIDVVAGPVGVRQYSLCGDIGARDRWTITIRRDAAGRGGSDFLHQEAAVGGFLRVSAPRNHFPLLPAARYLFVAAGVGITPIRPMVDQARAEGADWTLYYGGRTRRAMAFVDELDAIGERVHVRPADVSGRLPVDQIAAEASRVAGTAVYCCGPAPVMDALAAALGDRPDVALHVERFQASTPTTAPDGEEFDIVLEQSGRELRVPAHRTVLEVLEEAGVDLLSSCRSGICGTCEIAVLDGRPDHRDDVLSDDERASNALMMPCVSRSQGPRLVVDL